MIRNVNDRETLYINNSDYIFEEYPGTKSVLNGWIFSLFGIYDYLKIIKDKGIEEIFNKSLLILERNIEKYNNGYWSLYDQSRRLTSPTYYDLHISLLKVLTKISKKIKYILLL